MRDRYPAIDVVASCTHELHRLRDDERALAGQALADALVAIEDNEPGSAIDWVLEQIDKTNSNQQILTQLSASRDPAIS